VTGVDDGMVTSIKKVLQSKSEQDVELRTLFESALHCVSTGVNQVLSDYRNQRLIGIHVDRVLLHQLVIC